MTKVYVVKFSKKNETEINISAVFTNMKKAEAYANYWNKALPEFIYWVRSYDITQDDFSKIPF